ncbi:MAG: tRNA (adenosine(37)-N6)-threonylcarbamoyltransferase complex dimerization subunit type 1 TsaB [Patescibacteria group bacterium]
MYLAIDTSQHNKLIVGLKKERRIFFRKIAVEFNEAEKLLPLIDDLLKKSKSRLADLKAIFVAVGPGPFTSLRIGITIANTLAYSLKIPVIGFKCREFKGIKEMLSKGEKRLSSKLKSKFVFPFYGLAPHITKAKKKW